MTQDSRIFPHDKYSQLMENTFQQLRDLSILKGGEYSGDTDRLANFRRNAAALGLDYRQIWAVYSAKHWDAIIQYVKDLAEGKQRRRLEGLEGRCDDLIVYLLLFKAMLQESSGIIRHEHTLPTRPPVAPASPPKDWPFEPLGEMQDYKPLDNNSPLVEGVSK